MAMRGSSCILRDKAGRSMEDGLASELADCYQNQGSRLRKKMTRIAWQRPIKPLLITSGNE